VLVLRAGVLPASAPKANSGGQAAVPNVSGTCRDLTESVNQLAGNLTAQVRNIAQVTTAVPTGDLVGAENPVTACDLHVLVDEAAEPVSSQRPDGCSGERGVAPVGGR